MLTSSYIQYFLNSWEFVSFASHLTEGDRPRISFEQIASYPFPLAPLPEQRRIVAAIETHFSRLDAAVAKLKRIQTNLKRYRAAVLKAACEGRLVDQDPSDEPADHLLARILAERRRQWQTANPGKKYTEPAAPQTDDLPPLPQGWMWVRSEQICDFITKGTTPSANKLTSGSGEVPFIKVYNLTFDGYLDFTINPTFVSKDVHNGELGRSIVYSNDVLMNIVGPPLGKVSLVPNMYPQWNINQAIARFRCIPGVIPHFLSACLRSGSVLSWATNRAKATAGQFNLTLEICRDLPIPLPPLAEQTRIVAEVERRLSVIDAMVKAVSADLQRAARLRQAILHRAFRGRLVPQDPTDEPAHRLLERIKRQ